MFVFTYVLGNSFLSVFISVRGPARHALVTYVAAMHTPAFYVKGPCLVSMVGSGYPFLGRQAQVRFLDDINSLNTSILTFDYRCHWI